MAFLFAGLDVSTQSCKLVVIDYKSGDVVFVDSVGYDEDLPHYETKDGVIQGLPEGVSESNPKMWLDAVDLAFEKLRSSGVPVSEIGSLSVSGQQHGLVALDREGKLTRERSKLWNDYSTQEECQILTDRLGGVQEMIEAVGNSQRPGYTAPKIFHMARHEPEAFSKTKTLFLVHNYINWYLTGGVRVMEPGDTSGMALWNPRTGAFSSAVLEAIHPDLGSKLPQVVPSNASIGSISADLVERFGFSPECTIDAGSGDNMYGAVGTGNVAPGIVTVSLGTSGTAYSFMEEPFIDPEGEIAAFCDSTGGHLPLLCVSNLANGYNEMRRVHGLSHDDFDRAATAVPPAEEGRLLIPWFGGERTPDLPQARPVLFGFSLESLSPEKLCRAVLDGHVLNLHAGFSRLPVDVKEIRVTGGLSRSGVWCQTIADVFAAEVVPVEGEGAALGAALHAAWVWLEEEGRDAPLAELIEPFIILDQKGRKRPLAENRAAYSYLRQQYRALSRRLRGLEAEDPFALRPEDAFY
jgi:xylulokinase